MTSLEWGGNLTHFSKPALGGYLENILSQAHPPMVLQKAEVRTGWRQGLLLGFWPSIQELAAL